MRLIFVQLASVDYLWLAKMATVTEEVLIDYFYSWRTYKEIIKRLHHDHGILRSVSWLKRQFKKLGLKKRRCNPPLDTVRLIIKRMLQTSDCLRGYKSIWRLLRIKYRIIVARTTVMKIMQELDPEGVEQRARKRLKRRVYITKGPNDVWHLDGYDKLKPYGFSIHGCIDGYSRQILWLKLASTNNNPRVIARYFLECAEKLGCCPKKVRMDYGTENCSVAKIQIAWHLLFEENSEAIKSVIYGPSTANIRIEAFWSQWRRYKCNWWINFFHDLVVSGSYHHSNKFHNYCLTYVFEKLLQQDIDEFVKDWNMHPIRKNKLSAGPWGRPNDMYDMPTLYGGEDQKCPADSEVWLDAMLHESSEAPSFYPEEFSLYASLFLLVKFGFNSRDNITHSNGKNVYTELVNSIQWH